MNNFKLTMTHLLELHGQITFLPTLLMASLLLMSSHVLAKANNESDSVGYLRLKPPITYLVPGPPKPDTSTAQLDLLSVHLARNASPLIQTQAFEDAAAYSYADLLPRFNEAAGTHLSLCSRPILAHMLKLVFNDVGYYISKAKDENPRPRPYVEDPTIVPCQTDYLRASDQKSYPSGHAANGYMAALLLSNVMPERSQSILLRGIQYGDNRIMCGVHHPKDVEQGRLIATVYFKTIAQQSEFMTDLNCAIEEHEKSVAVRTEKKRPVLTTFCQARSDKYKV